MDQFTIKQEFNHDHEEDSDLKNVALKNEINNDSSIVLSPNLSIDQVDGSMTIPTQLPPSSSKHSVRLCSKVKKEEEGGEIKLEWDGDECDCLECRVEREIKIEFNQNNANIQQQANSSGKSQSNQSGTSCQHLFCKRVKKDEDSEWDEDCDCDDCRRNRQKAIQLKQTNLFPHSSEQLIVNESEQICCIDSGKDCEDAVGTNRDELEDEGKNDQECGNGKISEDDETEIDDEEYEMEIDADASSDDEETEVDEQFDREPDFQSSRNNKPSEGKHVCEQCGKTFTRPSNLTAHIRTHTCEMTFKCQWERCEKTFTQKSHLTQHYKSHTGEDCKMCEQCGKIIKNSSFNYHIRTHTNERPFKCTWQRCKKEFIRYDRMKVHYKTHTGERPHVCEQCDKRFLVKHNLKAHIRTHTNERPFKCPWEGCNKTFNRNNNMQEHYKIHTGERTYKCNFPKCGWDFLTHNQLKTHSITHSNKRSFACHYEGCTNKYKHKSTLINHQKAKHNRT